VLGIFAPNGFPKPHRSFWEGSFSSKAFFPLVPQVKPVRRFSLVSIAIPEGDGSIKPCSVDLIFSSDPLPILLGR